MSEPLISAEEPDTPADRKLREWSRRLYVAYLTAMGVSLATMGLLIAVFFLSSSMTLTWDYRAILSSVVGVVLLSSAGLLFLSRRDGPMLFVFTHASLSISFLTLGLCIWYL